MDNKLLVNIYDDYVRFYNNIKSIKSLKKIKDYCLSNSIQSGICYYTHVIYFNDVLYDSSYLIVGGNGDYWTRCPIDCINKKQLIKTFLTRINILKDYFIKNNIEFEEHQLN